MICLFGCNQYNFWRHLV